MTKSLRIRGRVRLNEVDVRDEIWVVDGVVRFTRPAGDADEIEGFALPGLVDAHSHIGLDAHGPIDAAGARIQAETERSAGTLLIRDAGSPSDTRWIDDDPDLPRIIRAGRHIARTRRYVRNFAEEIEPDQLASAMTRQARRGDGWVKIVGDWIDRDAGDLTSCWPGDAVREGIAAAHRQGARVTAHCFGEASLLELAEAGIDCIEHATGLTDETIRLFADRGVAIVPTLVNIRQFPRIAEPARAKFPGYQRHMIDLWKRRHGTVRTAHEAGVAVYSGTDAGGVLPHGLIAEEVYELTLAGLTPMEAIAAATWKGRDWLGRPSLSDGSPADLVVYPADPLDDVTVLRYPRAVVLRGRVWG